MKIGSTFFTRRSVVAGGLGLFAAPALLRAQQLFSADPFRLGVAAGEPSADGFVLWTRLAPDPLAPNGGMPMAPIQVDWEVTAEGSRTAVAHGTALARPELAHSVHVEVTGLQPDRAYGYRFHVGRESSIAGRARTLPAVGASASQVRFGVCGCQHYENGWYTAFGHLAAEDLAFVYHYGDYIYEGRDAPEPRTSSGRPLPFVREHAGQELYTLDDYRRRYAQYKLDPNLQAAHAAAAWFATFDDHEVENNWVGEIDENGTPPEIFALRRAAAFQAYYEHMPFRRAQFPVAGGMLIHRRASVGNLLDLHLLDTRQFRTDQPCDDGFKPYCAGWNDPRAQVLGLDQEQWLGAALRNGHTRWNAIAQQVMMMPLDRRTGNEPAPIRNMDSWASYNVPRERLLSRFAGRGDVVVLTGDEHQNFAGELRRDNGSGEAVAVEFVGTSITSGGDGAERRAGADRILAENPFLKWSNDRRGYMVCDIDADHWQTSFRTVDHVTTPGAPVSTAATYAVERGRPTLVRVGA